MFENMIYPFMAILLLMNGLFIAVSFMPAHQVGAETLGDVWGTSIIADMNGTMNIFGTQFPTAASIVSDTNTEATTNEATKVDVFQGILFGVGTFIGGAISLVNFMTQALFGYWFWLDFLLNPVWHPLVGALNIMLKTVFFLIEIVGIVSFAKGFFIFRNLF
jgi:hypothetical protein